MQVIWVNCIKFSVHRVLQLLDANHHKAYLRIQSMGSTKTSPSAGPNHGPMSCADDCSEAGQTPGLNQCTFLWGFDTHSLTNWYHNPDGTNTYYETLDWAVFLQPPVTSSLLVPHMLLSVLLKHLNYISSLNARAQVIFQQITVGKVMVLCPLILKLLDRRQEDKTMP
jgi:hypothetical protein